MEEAIATFKENNKGRVPEKIIFYRDGCQNLSAITSQEIEMIESAIEKSGHKIQLMYIAVSKKV